MAYRNYKVPGKKMSLNMDNSFDKAHKEMVGGTEGQKRELKALGENTRHLNPAYPSWRRRKRAYDKLDAGLMIKPLGSLERSIYKQHQRNMAEWASEVMCPGYY